jgi:hypothetical protein
MDATNKEEKAIHECYVRLFKESEPSVDFNTLMLEAKINDKGEKIIPFEDYEITLEKYDEIVDSIINEYDIKPEYSVKMFKTTIALGCSPKFKTS